MDQVRRGWGRDDDRLLRDVWRRDDRKTDGIKGWWCCDQEGWTGFAVKVLEDVEETLFRRPVLCNELEMAHVLQCATHVHYNHDVHYGIEEGSRTLNVAEVLQITESPLPCIEHLSIAKPTPTIVRSVLEAVASNKLPGLTYLRLYRVFWVDEVFESLVAAAKSGCLSALKTLSVSADTWSLRGSTGSSAHMILAKATQSGHLIALEKLELSGTDLRGMDWTAFASASDGGKLPFLKGIAFTRCRMGNSGARALGCGMRLSEMNYLDLSRNEIGDEGMEALADSFQVGLDSVLPNLQYLNLAGNAFTKAGVLCLAKAISSGRLNALTRLDMSRNGIVDEGLEALADSFQVGADSVLPNLQYLNLARNAFTKAGVLYLSKAISSGRLSALTGLDMSKNGIPDEGLEALASSFQVGLDSVLPNLQYLNLAGNGFAEAGVVALGKAISSGRLNALTGIDMSKNRIPDEGLEALANSFQVGLDSVLPNLQYLDLAGNAFTEAGIPSLAKAISSGRLNSLETLIWTARENVFSSEEGARTWVSALANLKNLTAVSSGLMSFTALKRRVDEIIERNRTMRAIMNGLEGCPVVTARVSKVYVCGDQEVGKTTLRKTLERSRLRSWLSWEGKPHVEQRTRGIDVSPVKSKGPKQVGNPITLLVWDMAGQNEYHLLHNAVFLDLNSARGRSTCFIIVCRSDTDLQESKQQLIYWLRFIASSCGSSTGNTRHVLVVVNKFKGDSKVQAVKKNWEALIAHQRQVFRRYLNIHEDPFLVDVRKYKSVLELKEFLFRRARSMVEEVPEICEFIEDNLQAWSKARSEFPVLEWKQFVKEVHEQSRAPWAEEKLEAATRYLNEAGVLVYVNLGTPHRRLVVLNPNWFCNKIAGKMFLQQDMVNPKEPLFRKRMDNLGSMSICEFKELFDYPAGKWTDLDFHDLISILLWLGLCYQGSDQRVYIPALIPEDGKPVWKFDHTEHQWVMGFVIEHKKSATSLAPIALWHRFQVELAQTSRFNGSQDNAFRNGRYFISFSADYMNVVIEVSREQGSPTFDGISIFVKPLWKTDDLDGKERKQRQVDLAGELVEVLLTKVWDKVCPGVEYLERVVWPWPACHPRPTVPAATLEVAEVKKWVEEHGLDKKMQILVGSDTITGDQLLSTRHKREMGIVPKGRREDVESRLFLPEVSSIGSTLESLQIEELSEQKILRKLDLIYDTILRVSKENRDVLTEHGELLHKLQNSVEFFCQDWKKTCPIFIYVEEKSSSFVVNKVRPWKRYCLRFACEAKFKDYSLHEVKGQQGLDMPQLKDWAQTIGAPWLKVCLTILLLSANVAANVVLPGVGLLVPSFVQYQQWSMITGEVASATAVTKEQLTKIIKGMDVDHIDADRNPQELYGKSVEAVRKLLSDLTPKAFQEKVGLRKVCLYDDHRSLQKIAWICDECYEKYSNDHTHTHIREL